MNQQVELATRSIVKKITTKVVCGKPNIEDLIAFMNQPGNTKDSVMPLFNIIGRAGDAVAGESDHGPFVKLLGQFKAVNSRTGEEFRSGSAILPGSANDMVYGALKGLDANGGAIEFAFRVGIKRDAETPTGYTYVVEQIYQAGQRDALSDLENRLALAAPASNVKSISAARDVSGDAEAEAEAEAQAQQKVAGKKK